MQQIRLLCSDIYNVEWSGVLFYEIISGDINQDMVLEAKYIYPMDKGSKAETGFTYWEDVLDVYDWNEEYEEMEYGLIHSHNTMSTFFSGTDKQELLDNASNFIFYLSLIVNNTALSKSEPEFCARVAQQVKIEKKYTASYSIKNKLGNLLGFSNEGVEEETKVLYWDVDIEYPTVEPLADDFFINRMKEIQRSGFRKPKFSKIPRAESFSSWRSNIQSYEPSLFEDLERIDPVVKEPDTKDIVTKFIPKLIEVDADFKGTVGDAINNTTKYFSGVKKSEQRGRKGLYIDAVVQSFDVIWDHCFGFTPSINNIRYTYNIVANKIAPQYKGKLTHADTLNLIKESLKALIDSYE